MIITRCFLIKPCAEFEIALSIIRTIAKVHYQFTEENDDVLIDLVVICKDYNLRTINDMLAPFCA